ncbi:hypothetical protein BZM27_27185 [Paraburkholderia steynii]|uniref:cysteine desulfurase n=1 Tax=Paraburkholderia steynii TaxID=1245441 RepID=A0A4R0X7Z7_9BURK|nr:hypothetical protein BZM27_27185 [Paraburkholderia steynii]
MSDFQRVSTGLHPCGANPVHLDHVATTPVDPRVIRRMLPYRTEMYGNSTSRSHAHGRVGEEAVELAREQVSSLVNGDPHEIVWTSGVTESNNLAIKGAAHLHRAKGNPLMTLTTEHQSVLGAMLELDRDGLEVTVVPVQESGLVDLAVFEAALHPGAVLASGMFVNNETGVIQDIAAIGAPCRARGILPHVDAAQAAGKVPIDLAALPVDLMSFSAHKIYGPKGIGALYAELRPRMRIACQMHGGVHERGMRSGMLCTHQIVEELPLPPVEIQCSVLAEDAIQAAVSDFRSRQTIRGAAADDL